MFIFREERYVTVLVIFLYNLLCSFHGAFKYTLLFILMLFNSFTGIFWYVYSWLNSFWSWHILEYWYKWCCPFGCEPKCYTRFPRWCFYLIWLILYLFITCFSFTGFALLFVIFIFTNCKPISPMYFIITV